MWIDPSDTTKRTLSGSLIVKLSDKSGHGRDATVPVTNPTLSAAAIGGRDAANFTIGGAEYFQLGDLSSLSAAEIWIVRKLASDTPATTNGHWFIDGGSTANRIPHTDGKYYDSFFSTTRRATSAAVTGATVSHYYRAISTSSEWTSYLGATQLLTTGTNTVNPPGATATLGFASDSTPSAMLTGELVVFDGKLSAGDVASMRAYLIGRWGCS
jgi:hypothetical protein